MNDYEKYVAEAQRNKIDTRFANSIIDHARILIKYIVKDAKHEIKILSDSLNEAFYNKLEEDFIAFLDKDKSNKIKIITLESLEANSFIIKLKNSYGKERIQTKQIDKSSFPIDDDSKETANYVVNDNNAFRYEYSDKYLSKGVVNAIANFNNGQDSETLSNNFNELFVS